MQLMRYILHVLVILCAYCGHCTKFLGVGTKEDRHINRMQKIVAAMCLVTNASLPARCWSDAYQQPVLIMLTATTSRMSPSVFIAVSRMPMVMMDV